MTSSRGHGRFETLLSAAGPGLLTIASLGRLPFAMNVVGVLTLLTITTQDVPQSSAVSAVYGLSVAVGAPLVGGFADRVGDRLALFVVTPIHCVGLGILTVGASQGWEWSSIIALAVLSGATSPQLSPLMRARWIRLLDKKPGAVPFAMGYESLLDELSFALGPITVSALAAWLSPEAPLLVSITGTALFAVLFAMHHTRSPARTPLSGDEVRQKWLTPQIGIVLVSMLGIGLTFGGVLGTVNAYAELEGRAATAGLVYAAMSGCAGIASIIAPYFVTKTSTNARLWCGAVLIALGTSGLALLPDLAGQIPALMTTGIGLGVLLVTSYAEAGRLTPPAKMNTVMSLIGGVVALGNSVGISVAGQLAVDGSGPRIWAAALGLAAVLFLAAAVRTRMSHLEGKQLVGPHS